MRWKKPIVLSLTLIATSCAAGSTGTGVRTVHDYCLLAKGIGYSQQGQGQAEDSSNRFDTAETVTAVVAHNVTYVRTCPNG